MRLPRGRITTRWLMIVVAIVGTTIGVTIQATRWWRLSAEQWDMADRYSRAAAYIRAIDQRTRLGAGPGPNAPVWDYPPQPSVVARTIDYYEGLTRKYERAAWLPWLPVEPDPPGPE